MHLFEHIYFLLVTLPDHFYPFANEVNGRWVRGIRSYKKALAKAVRKNGPGRMGYKLTLYRQGFHLLGSVLFILFAALVSKDLLVNDAALYFLMCAAIAALTYQEFYFHPRRYGQRLKKGVIDWSFWVVPMLIYLFH